GNPITTTLTMPTFLNLLTTITQKINNKDTTPTTLTNTYQNPTSSQELIHSGDMSLATYVSVAGRVQRYMDRYLIAPNYSSYSGLGSYFGYENLIYTYSKILTTYNNTKTLPSTIAVVPWNKFTIDQVADAATYVKNYVDNNHKLPSYVTINGVKVEMSSFLLILTTAVTDINNNTVGSVYYNYCASADSPCDSQSSGEMDLDEYADIAGRVQRYTERYWEAPNYSSYSSFGTYFGYHNMIYTFSKIMSYYDQNGELPDSVAVQSWFSIILPQLNNVPSSLLICIQPTKNCQCDNAAIESLAYKLASGGNSVWEVADNIFTWVRDNINYSFYYNTKYGAVGTLNKGAGNCVDTTHLMIALARAVGVPARYVHGNCYFTTSGQWYGHVFAQFYINGKWYNADGTSYRNTLGTIKNWNTSTWILKQRYAELPF
ncbi:transglutaminase domain-containing protein, partial [Methanobacterium petrolearium]